MVNKNSNLNQNNIASKVSKAAGVIWNILPGESSEFYQSGLQSTLNELGAKTELQIYLAEKIFQCLWWIRRYETQKHSSIIDAMANEITDYTTTKPQLNAIRTLLQAQLWNDKAILEIIESKGHTTTSLLEAAIAKQQDSIHKLDQQIALRVKTLAQLQQSFEALANRAEVQERLKLQNELIKRDLKAIDIKVNIKETSDTSDAKLRTKNRKQD